MRQASLAGMFHYLRQLSCRARFVVLVLFTLTLVVQPVFAAVGELHELAHDPSGRHVSLVLDAGSHVDRADAHASGVAVGIFHVLVDGAHGGGPGTAMAPLLCMPHAWPSPTLVLRALSPALHDTLLPGPFKPPRFV